MPSTHRGGFVPSNHNPQPMRRPTGLSDGHEFYGTQTQHPNTGVNRALQANSDYHKEEKRKSDNLARIEAENDALFEANMAKRGWK